MNNIYNKRNEFLSLGGNLSNIKSESLQYHRDKIRFELKMGYGIGGGVGALLSFGYFLDPSVKNFVDSIFNNKDIIVTGALSVAAFKLWFLYFLKKDKSDDELLKIEEDYIDILINKKKGSMPLKQKFPDSTPPR